MAKKGKGLSLEEKLEQALVPTEITQYKIPDNWCWAYFQSIIELISGRDVSNSICNDKGKGIPYVMGASNIQGNFFIAERWIEEPVVVSKKGDILLTVKGTIGKICFQIEPELNISRQIMAIRCSESVEPRFIYWFLSYICEELRTLGNGLIPGISRDDILRYRIGLPPKTEQKRIVDAIESMFAKLDEAKEIAENAIDSYDNRKNAIIGRAFSGELSKQWRYENNVSFDTWKETTIGDISDVKGGKRVPKGMELVSENTGQPYIKAGNLKKGTVIDDKMMYVPDEVFQYIKNYTVATGDVYITNVGACIGDCGIIPDKYDGANLTENAVKITNYSGVGKYIVWYLSSNQVQQHIKNLIASATLGKLSIANIKTIGINMPTEDEQTIIVELLEGLLMKENRASGTAEDVIDSIDLMKKSILAKAFRGELGTNIATEESSLELLKNILSE